MALGAVLLDCGSLEIYPGRAMPCALLHREGNSHTPIFQRPIHQDKNIRLRHPVNNCLWRGHDHLSPLFLNDYKNTSLADFAQVVQEIQREAKAGTADRGSEKILKDISAKADEKIRSIGIFFISIVVAVIIMATIASAVEEQSATVNEIAGSLSAASEKLGFSNSKVSQASVYADEMAKMANTVTDAAIQVDEAVVAIFQTSELLQELADNSAKTTHQFRT